MSGFFDHGYAHHAGGDPKAAAVGAVPSETTPLIAHQDRTPPLSRVFALLYSTIDPQLGLPDLLLVILEYSRRHHLAVTVKPAPKVSDADRANNSIPPDNEAEERCAELMWCDGRSLLERIIGGPCSRLPIKNIFIACCLIATMPSGKRELERVGNPPVSTGPSPNSDERANNTVEEVNGPTRGSGSLHLDLM
ncbi:hypothetical protein T01_6755 [Trichinella spiralis]|uniref:Uncharacterized protein n=1 Tax=Trichinella spiralis TaxID=6334 RepID=A0A0V1B7J9_TRISP|nr:hypothetical protein T01_6755 [Trichinella spiralis]